MSHIPTRWKIVMWIAFYALLGAWAWVAHSLIYNWLPIWLTDILLVVGISVAGYMVTRDWLRSRREKLRDHGLPGSPD